MTEDDARRLVEEASRLLGALGGAGHAGAGHDGAGHDGTGQGGPECRVCPVCRVLATVREIRPEVLDHLAAAAEELFAAAREFATPSAAGRAAGSTAGSTAGPSAGSTAGSSGRTAAAAAEGSVGAGPARSGVQRIEITD